MEEAFFTGEEHGQEHRSRNELNVCTADPVGLLPQHIFCAPVSLSAFTDDPEKLNTSPAFTAMDGHMIMRLGSG